MGGLNPQMLGGLGLGGLGSGKGGGPLGQMLGGLGLGQGILPMLLAGKNPFTGPSSAYGLAQQLFGGGSGGSPMQQFQQLLAQLTPEQKQKLMAQIQSKQAGYGGTDTSSFSGSGGLLG